MHFWWHFKQKRLLCNIRVKQVQRAFLRVFPDCFFKYWKNCNCSTFKLSGLKNTFAERCMDLGVFVQNTCDSEIFVENTCDSDIFVENTCMNSSHHILWISTLRDFPFAILLHIKVHFKWASNRYQIVSSHHPSR